MVINKQCLKGKISIGIIREKTEITDNDYNESLLISEQILNGDNKEENKNE